MGAFDLAVSMLLGGLLTVFGQFAGLSLSAAARGECERWRGLWRRVPQ